MGHDTRPTTTKKRKRHYTYKCKNLSSFKIFQKFVEYPKNTNYDPENLVCDASPILSLECYKYWLSTRKSVPKLPEEAFRRAVTAHCRGADGRKPFPPEVEESLLKELRKKEPWSCFKNNAMCGAIGVQGFPSLGFHEKNKGRKQVEPLKKKKKKEVGVDASSLDFFLSDLDDYLENFDLLAVERLLYNFNVEVLKFT